MTAMHDDYTIMILRFSVLNVHRLTDAEIEKMINDAAKFKKADQQAKKRRADTILSTPPTLLRTVACAL